jgi:hypothetical protein
MLVRFPVIRAEVHTDDFAFTAKFDALPFFELATPEQILDLAKCEWGGDYPADDVARFFIDKPGYEDVTQVFAYASKVKSGFECHVYEPEALHWLYVHRPDVFQMLEIKDYRDDWLNLGDPHWDEDYSWNGDYNMTPWGIDFEDGDEDDGDTAPENQSPIMGSGS